MAIFQIIVEDAVLTCVLAGTFKTTDVTSNPRVDKGGLKFIALDSSEWKSDTTPCTKQPSTSGALPNCKGSMPAKTLSVFPKFDGKKALVNFTPIFMKENMIPAFLYSSFTSKAKVT